MYERLVGVRGQLAELVTALDPDAVSGSTARRWWAEFDRIERLAAAGKTLLARRVAQAHRPDRSGSKTATEELARKAGTSAGAAKEAMDTSERLPGQPGLDKAIRRGELSAVQAGLISAAAAVNPAEEHRLTQLAGQVSLAELREECARVKAAADPDPDATNRRLQAGRRLRRWTDREGFWNLHAKGSPQAGALFNTVLDPIIDRIFKTARTQGRREHPDAYAFDALIHLADHATGHCTCHHPTQATRGAYNDRADAAAGSGDHAHTTEAGLGAAGDDIAGAAGDDIAGAAGDDIAGAAGAYRAAAADVADAAPDEAAGVDPAEGDAPTDIPDADEDAAEPVAADPPETIGATAGDPGIFAAPASAAGSVGQSGSGCVAPGRSTNPRYLALLRVDAAALRRGQVQGEELCEIAGVGPIPVSVARDLLGDAILKLVITNGVDVANVTHLGRGPTTAQKIALLWTNPTCSVQGCDRRRIEYDHQKPWAQTRHTRLDELDPLCGFHHDLKTRLHWGSLTRHRQTSIRPTRRPPTPPQPEPSQRRRPTVGGPRPDSVEWTADPAATTNKRHAGRRCQTTHRARTRHPTRQSWPTPNRETGHRRADDPARTTSRTSTTTAVDQPVTGRTARHLRSRGLASIPWTTRLRTSIPA